MLDLYPGGRERERESVAKIPKINIESDIVNTNNAKLFKNCLSQ